ncbi:hypothetical protein Tco_0154734 [Tanacetum coccineum]
MISTMLRLVFPPWRGVTLKTIIHTSDDDQIDSNIIFDDPFVENNGAGLGYKNPERLKKAIAAQPKMYNGDMLYSVNLKIDSPDSEETLEDAEESRLKMRNKMVQINYGKLNVLYKTFVPQQEFSVEQTYFSISSTSTNGSESKAVTLDLPIPKMSKEKNLKELKEELIVEKNELLKDELAKSSSDSKDIQAKLLKRIKILENNSTQTQHKKELDELIEHVNQKTYAYADVRAQNQDLLITIYELKNKLKTIDKGKNVNTKFDKSEASGTLLCVTPLPKNIAIKAKKVSNSKVNADRSKPVTSHPTPINEQGQTQNENVLARGMYRITKQNSNVKRALFTAPVAATSKNLRATSVVVKSRLSVVTTPKATNKVIQLVLWIVDSGCSKHMTGNLQLLRNFVEKFMGIVRFRNDHFAAILQIK